MHSEPTWKSLWQRYSVEKDRVVLECWFSPDRKINFYPGDIESIEVVRPPVFIHGLWSLKLDWADLFKHVRLKARNKIFTAYHFTPQNPEEFVRAVSKILQPASLETPGSD